MAVDRIEEGKKIFESKIQPIYNNNGTFSIEGKKYKFNETICNCMDNNMRKPTEGCKHMNYIKLWISVNKDPRTGEIESLQDKFKELISYMETQGNAVYSETLYEKFGTELIDDAEKHNVIITAGKMFVLIL